MPAAGTPQSSFRYRSQLRRAVYAFSSSRRWSSRFSVSGQIGRRRNKLKLELQRRSGHTLNWYRSLDGTGVSPVLPTVIAYQLVRTHSRP